MSITIVNGSENLKKIMYDTCGCKSQQYTPTYNTLFFVIFWAHPNGDSIVHNFAWPPFMILHDFPTSQKNDKSCKIKKNGHAKSRNMVMQNYKNGHAKSCARLSPLCPDNKIMENVVWNVGGKHQTF